MTAARSLDAVLEGLPRLAIAVSGGVDSMTLAHAAHRRGLHDLVVVHAVSPAVPEEASARVRGHAARFGWQLREIDAGEFADPDYRANPVNRCYFCKTNLYARIARVTDAPIAAGTNRDDLADYRPGLTAAAEHRVRHPFVEAGMDKKAVRALAHAFGLDDIAELPAQPCLSSRVETGIAIRAEDLAFIARMEQQLRPRLPPGTDLRCRVTHHGIMIETGAGSEDGGVQEIARGLCASEHRRFLGVRPYRRGAAFLRDQP
jgi:uncharacterized protein